MPAPKEQHRHIAPRLASGLKREANYGALPPHIKHGLRLIAARENKSVSWVLETIIYKYFGFTPPQFVGAREVEVVDPENYSKVVKQVSREKFVKHAKQRPSLTARATTLIERSKAAAPIH